MTIMACVNPSGMTVLSTKHVKSSVSFVDNVSDLLIEVGEAVIMGWMSSFMESKSPPALVVARD